MSKYISLKREDLSDIFSLGSIIYEKKYLTLNNKQLLKIK